jgi:endonuclease YncB( thermonuclease family)
MILKHLKLTFLVGLTLSCATPIAFAQGFLTAPLFSETGTAKAVEADHIVVNDLVVGLYGIDAPLRIQPCIKDGREFACGVEARHALDALLEQGPVTCEQVRDPNMRRRMLRFARCTIGDMDVAAEMVRLGMAMAFPPQSDEYVALEQAAKAAGAGLWSADEFRPPWEWEEERQQEQ